MRLLGDCKSSGAGYARRVRKVIKPSIAKVTALFDLDIGAGRHVLSKLLNRWKEQAHSMDLDFEVAHIKSASDIEQVFAILGGSDTIMVGPDSTLAGNIRLVIQLAENRKVPAIYSYPGQVKLGGLMSYGADDRQIWRNTASYVGQLLAGTKVRDLPIQQPTRYMLHLNLATAKKMELTVPRTLVGLADEVLE
jgi:putative ABC transport system substrate-binding protein